MLEQIPVCKVRNARFGVDFERVDTLKLRGQALCGLDRSLAVGVFCPTQRALAADDRAFEERSGESDQIGDELVERISPAALRELVRYLVSHLVSTVLCVLQHPEPEVLANHLFEFSQLLFVRSLPRVLDQVDDLLGKHLLHLSLLLG